MLSNTPRVWMAGAGVLGASVIAASWFLLITPEEAQASALRQQTSATVAANQVLSADLEQLRRDYVQLPTSRGELALLEQRVPANLALATVTEQIAAAASTAGVTLIAITPSAPAVAAGSASAPAGPAVVAASPAPGAASASAAGGSAVPAAPAGAPAVAAAAAAAATPEGTSVGMPLTIQVVGSYAKTQLFLQGLQSMPRDLLVTGLTSTAEPAAPAGAGKPATVNGDVTLDVTGQVFVLPTASRTSTAVTP